MADRNKSQFLMVGWQFLLVLWKDFILQVRRTGSTRVTVRVERPLTVDSTEGAVQRVLPLNSLVAMGGQL